MGVKAAGSVVQKSLTNSRYLSNFEEASLVFLHELGVPELALFEKFPSYLGLRFSSGDGKTDSLTLCSGNSYRV